MDVDQWRSIWRRVLQEGASKRQILRETGMHWETLQKILTHPSPPGISTTSTATRAQDRSLSRSNRGDPGGRQTGPSQATSHGQADLGASAGRGVRRRLHHRQRCRLKLRRISAGWVETKIRTVGGQVSTRLPPSRLDASGPPDRTRDQHG